MRVAVRAWPSSFGASREAVAGGNARSPVDAGVDEAHPLRRRCVCARGTARSASFRSRGECPRAFVRHRLAMWLRLVGLRGAGEPCKPGSRPGGRHPLESVKFFTSDYSTPTVSRCGNRTSATTATEIRTSRLKEGWIRPGEIDTGNRGGITEMMMDDVWS